MFSLYKAAENREAIVRAGENFISNMKNSADRRMDSGRGQLEKVAERVQSAYQKKKDEYERKKTELKTKIQGTVNGAIAAVNGAKNNVYVAVREARDKLIGAVNVAKGKIQKKQTGNYYKNCCFF